MAPGRPWLSPQDNSPVPSARLRRCPGVHGTPKTAAAADETRLLSEVIFNGSLKSIEKLPQIALPKNASVSKSKITPTRRRRR